MNKRRIGGFLVLLLVAAMPLMARQTKTQQTSITPDYIRALGEANKFLIAWQSRDAGAGLSMLSSRLKGKQSEEDLRMYVSGLSSPHHAAFEIGNGQKLADGRYAFDVRLYEDLTGSKEILPRPKPTRIVLLKTTGNEWQVDSLP